MELIKWAAVPDFELRAWTPAPNSKWRRNNGFISTERVEPCRPCFNNHWCHCRLYFRKQHHQVHHKMNVGKVQINKCYRNEWDWSNWMCEWVRLDIQEEEKSCWIKKKNSHEHLEFQSRTISVSENPSTLELAFEGWGYITQWFLATPTTLDPVVSLRFYYIENVMCSQICSFKQQPRSSFLKKVKCRFCSCVRLCQKEVINFFIHLAKHGVGLCIYYF